MISKQAKEAQLQHIFRLLVECHTQEEIARELNIGLKTVQRYTLEIDKRYGEMQAQKTDNTLFMECQLFKNRMLKIYRGLEEVILSKERSVSGTEKAKCAEVAANIAIDVLKMESEGIKAVKELISYGKGNNRLLQSIQSRYNINNTSNNTEQQEEEQSTIDDNNNNNDRKF